MKRALLVAGLCLALALAAALGWLLSSEAGLRWAWREIEPRLPGELSAAELSGRLLGPILLRDVTYRQDDLRIGAAKIELDWNPWALLHGKLALDDLAIDTLTLETPPSNAVRAEIELPTIALPLEIGLGQVDIRDIRITQAGATRSFERLRFSGDLQRQRIRIGSARLEAADFSVDLSGSLEPAGKYPHRIELGWQARLPSGAELSGSGSLEGDIDRTTLAQAVVGAVRGSLRLEFDTPLRAPAWRLDATLAEFDSARFAPGSTPIAGSATLRASGDLASARASGSLRVDAGAPWPVTADFDLQRVAPRQDFGGLEFEQLDLRTPDGRLVADGQVGWADVLNWSARIRASELNPARVAPDWPGALAGGVATTGSLAGGIADVTLEFDDFGGRLRDYPVALGGGLRWRGDVIEISALDFTTGPTRARIEGRIAEQLALRWSLDSPDLGALYPDAAGRLSARGELRGTRTEPGLSASFAGSALAWDDYRIGKIDGDARLELSGPLEPDAVARRLELKLEASDVLLGDYRLTRFALDGDQRRIDIRASSKQGSLHAELAGALEGRAWRGRLQNAQVENPDYGAWSLRGPAALVLSPESIGLQTACLDSDRGAAICAAVEGGAGDWRIETDTRAIELSWFRRWTPPELRADGVFGASARLQFTPANRLRGDIHVELDPGRLDYRLREAQFERIDYGGGKIDAVLADSGIRIAADLALRAGENFSGRLELPGAELLALDLEQQQLLGDGRIKLTDLGIVAGFVDGIENLDGGAELSARLQFTPAKRLRGDIHVDLGPGRLNYRLSEARFAGIDYGGGKIDAALADSGIRLAADLALRAGEKLGGRLELPGAELLAIDIDKQQLRADAQVNLAELGIVEAFVDGIENLDGGAEVSASLSGTLAQPRVDGKARLADVSFSIPRLRLRVERLQAEASSAGLENVDYRASAVIAGGRVELGGSTRLDAAAGWPSRLDLGARDLQLAQLLQGRLQPDMKIDGQVDADAALELRLPDDLAGTLRLSASNGTVAYPLPGGETARWSISQATAEAALGEDAIVADGRIAIGDNSLAGRLRLPGAKLLRIEPDGQAVEAGAELELKDLSLLASLVPDIQRPGGLLTARVDVGGTLAQPRLRGFAELERASLNVPRLGLVIEGIEASANTDNADELRFVASAKAGKGSLSLNGSSRLDAASGWPTVINIAGTDFPVARIPEAAVDLSPTLVVRIEDHAIDIKGEVQVPYARLQPRDVTTAAQVSDDTVIIGGEQAPQRQWRITSKVRLVLGERVSFFGFGFDGHLGGNLVIEEQTGQPTRGTGVINIVDGRYRAYGQHLDVESGRLLFTGGPVNNPGLDVRAVRVTGDVTAGVHVGGRLQQPEIDLFSSPAMGQTDILSYLLTGGPIEAANSQEGATMANAAIALGLAGGDRIARSIGDQFGFEDMRVESSSSGEQASLIVGRYLSPRLYVSYGVGLIESINTLNLRYKISPKWRIEAESGAAHGADLLYSIER